MTRPEESTRDLVRRTALRMFRERGFAATTMRAIATEAGVATGVAYYWFGSKRDLVQELYVEVNEDHARRAETALDRVGGLGPRLRALWHAGLDAFGPSHDLGAELVAVAIRPGAAESPFSSASAETARLSRSLHEQVVAGATTRVPAAVREELPRLLWLAWLGVTLFWVHDGSPGQRRARALVDGAAPLIARLVRVAGLPGVRSVVDDVVGLARQVGA
ncbi:MULTISPECIES: TetR/AcrR family transcriptional regulator [unclassified Isoptericola]|uniref:TetR/AcrR family transcriptional regulator n=1 Tax=unclassified Isoptericola TaxID=2623355 RepID=UPI0036489DF4